MPTKKKFLPSSLVGAIIVHAIVALFFIIGFQFKPDRLNNSASVSEAVVANVIDGEAIERERKRRLEQQHRQDAAEQERKRRLEEAKRAEQERKKQLEEQKQKQREEAEKKLAEERRLAEEAQRKAAEKQRLAAEAEKLALEKQRQLEAEKQRLEEQRKAAEAERKRLEEQKRLAAEAEKKRVEEQKRLAAEEEKKRLEEQRRLEQERLQREKEQEQKYLASILDEEESTIAAEEERIASLARQRELDRMTQEYAAILTSHIQNRWRRPSDFQAGTVCTVNIVQTLGGYIESLKISACSGGDAFRKSVEEAVYKAEPLPAPPTEEVFEREIKITFQPE